jgi:hypothetical protein
LSGSGNFNFVEANMIACGLCPHAIILASTKSELLALAALARPWRGTLDHQGAKG